ncbi:Extracellular serine proteinase [Smittium culicis]|uniref:Extracellular serine proteinase n=1 Tax=Smittium culicis TaxID=133412 RepID=A0A1R1XNW0_9FUNG|nr:Extracellular serine proteinase [Smittium culicis]
MGPVSVLGQNSSRVAPIYTSEGTITDGNVGFQQAIKSYNIVLKTDPVSTKSKRKWDVAESKYIQSQLEAKLNDHINWLKEKQSENIVMFSADSQNVDVNVTGQTIVGDSFIGYTATLNPSAMLQLANNNQVAYIEENYPIYPSVYQQWAPWGLTRINTVAPNRNVSFGAYSTGYTYTGTGAGATVYVLDSGVDSTHIEFNGGAIEAQKSFIITDATDGDFVGHGTAVSGILGGRKIGAAKGVSIKSVKVLSKNVGNVDSAMAGVQWVVQDWTINNPNSDKTAIINASFGTEGSYSRALNEVFKTAFDTKILPIIAAGNSASDACNSSPQSAGVGIVVGSISTSNDYQSSFSNFGGCVDIFAPGENIIYPLMNSKTNYKTDSGTSLSAPFVSGIAALYISKNPSATPDDIKKFLLSTATPSVTRLSSNTTNLLLNYSG